MVARSHKADYKKLELLFTPHASRTRNKLTSMISAAGIVLLSVLVLPVSATGQRSNSETLTIPDGTVVNVVITQDLNSGKDHQNDPAHGKLTEAVRVNGVVVLAKGTSVIGHITKAEPKGRWGHSGTLAYSLDYAKAVDGSNVRLRASSSQGGQQGKAALMLGLSGAFRGAGLGL